jgi:hypothetical protein
MSSERDIDFKCKDNIVHFEQDRETCISSVKNFFYIYCTQGLFLIDQRHSFQV